MLPKERKKLESFRKWLIFSALINFILIAMTISRYNDIKYIEIDHYIEMREHIEESSSEIRNKNKEIKILKDSIKEIEKIKKLELKKVKTLKQNKKIVKDTIAQIQIQTDSL